MATNKVKLQAAEKRGHSPERKKGLCLKVLDGQSRGCALLRRQSHQGWMLLGEGCQFEVRKSVLTGRTSRSGMKELRWKRSELPSLEVRKCRLSALWDFCRKVTPGTCAVLGA